ncbi:MAG: SGNH/GDSL hydrolase family protein [Rhizobiales bacterium]|nr:SGNH/GDSL hydrolase family protein [Hyphomicrobiales bacterium]
MIKNFLLLCCTALFGFALVEAFLYLVPSYQAGEPIAQVVFCTEPAHERMPNARFGETATPSSVYYRSESEADGWYLRAYNDQGFRDLMNTGAENVVILGDSFIEGELVDNDKTIPFLLDSWNPDLAFREFALGGWGTADEDRIYHAVGGEIDHRLVILGYFVGNDLADNLRARDHPEPHVASASGDDEARPCSSCMCCCAPPRGPTPSST